MFKMSTVVCSANIQAIVQLLPHTLQHFPSYGLHYLLYALPLSLVDFEAKEGI